MSIVLQHKVVSSLPSTLQPNSVYYVRVGTGFDMYITNSSGTVVGYQDNAKLVANNALSAVENKLNQDGDGSLLTGLNASNLASGTIPDARLPSTISSNTTGNAATVTNGVYTSRSITAGNGLTGGGSLAANRTLTLGTPSTITGTSTNSVSATSHTHAISLTASDIPTLQTSQISGLDSELSNLKGVVDRDIGNYSTYERAIVLLHPMYDGSLLSGGFVNGRITGYRGGSNASLRLESADVVTGSHYNATKASIVSFGSETRLVTCYYGQKKYLALELPYSASAWTSIRFQGFVSGENSLKIVPYYNTTTAVVINAEVNGSIAPYDTSSSSIITPSTITAGAFVGDGSGLTNVNAATATKLATARSINGVPFDGSGNITVVDSTRIATAGDTITGKISATEGYRSAGMYGTYDSTKVAHVWSMGTQYAIDNNGSTFGSLYGIAYKHTNNTTGGTMAGGHQIVFCSSGTPGSAIGLAGGMWTSGTSTAATFNATSVSGGGFQGIAADTASAPSFTWTADLNTGIYRPAADVIGFTAGGAERGRVNTTGFSGNGSQLTSLNASNLSSGTVPDARLPATITSSITGNAATATKLATARTINGVSFNGTANITIPTGNTKEYYSGNFAFTLAGEITLTHNFGEVAKSFTIEAYCHTSYGGLAVGDVIVLAPGYVGTTGHSGVQIIQSTNSVSLRIGAQGASIFLIKSTGGTAGYVHPNYFYLRVRMFA